MTVLAREVEAAGIATVLVTMMPTWSERIGVPRTLAVEHPYGQPMGPAGDRARQREVFRHALDLLARAERPGQIEESAYEWPMADARKRWHPPEPAPIVSEFLKNRERHRQ